MNPQHRKKKEGYVAAKAVVGVALRQRYPLVNGAIELNPCQPAACQPASQPASQPAAASAPTQSLASQYVNSSRSRGILGGLPRNRRKASNSSAPTGDWRTAARCRGISGTGEREGAKVHCEVIEHAISDPKKEKWPIILKQSVYVRSR